MNKLLRKLTISVLAVVFAVIAMGATTYAWFTVTGTVSVESMSTNVTMDQGIEVSADKITWTKNLTKANLTTNNLLTIPAVLDAVTTEDGIDFSRVTGFKRNASTSTNFDVLTSSTNADSYIQFKFYVRSAAYQTLYLYKGTTLDGSTVNNWVADVTYRPSIGSTDVLVNSTPTLEVEDALRFSINSKALSAFGNTDDENTYKFNDNGTLFGGTVVTTVWENAASSTNTKGFGTDVHKGALNYYLVKNSETIAAGDQLTTNPTAPTTYDISTDYGTTTVVTLAADTTNGDGYYYAEVTVKVWVEGWDAECFNAILSKDIDKDGTLEEGEIIRSIQFDFMLSAQVKTAQDGE